MNSIIWDLTPGDALFAEIDRLREGRQKRFILMVAEECLLYNKKYDTAYTLGEFRKLNYPRASVYLKPEDFEKEPE